MSVLKGAIKKNFFKPEEFEIYTSDSEEEENSDSEENEKSKKFKQS